MLTTHRKRARRMLQLSESGFDHRTGQDDRSSSLPSLEGLGQPHAANYLFNSMPCAYTWFYH